MEGYFHSIKSFQEWAWAELGSCRLSTKVALAPGAHGQAARLAGGKAAALLCSLGQLLQLPLKETWCSQAATLPKAEPRRSKWQPLTGMPVSRALCYASSLWSPLPATEKEIKEKLSSASYLCAPASFLSFFLFISDNCRGSETGGAPLYQPQAPPAPAQSCTEDLAL